MQEPIRTSNLKVKHKMENHGENIYSRQIYQSTDWIPKKKKIKNIFFCYPTVITQMFFCNSFGIKDIKAYPYILNRGFFKNKFMLRTTVDLLSIVFL